jgi:NAD(P)-dependent dehydrogenase (short-subunit alcohol dehydrogenase family)
MCVAIESRSLLTCLMLPRSSKSALHGLVHWLAGAYAKKGITVNGVAPALIEETKMLPGASAELSASKLFLLVFGTEHRRLADKCPRDSNR